jgi:uncharacterized cupin superfamily protein
MTPTAPTLPKVSDAAAATLEDTGLLKQATGPEMNTSALTIWEGENGAESGIWECTPGPSRWDLDTNEFIHIVSGRMTVTRDGEGPVEVGPGDNVVFEKGWGGTWQIEETIRKVYVVF